MLSQNQVVAVRKAIEMTYTGKCKIIENQRVLKPNKSTGFNEVEVLINQPCKLSFSRISTTNQNDVVSSLGQLIKVFLAPEIIVNPGSKIIVTQNGYTTEYSQSSKPAVYNTHQEIVLELFQGWS